MTHARSDARLAIRRVPWRAALVALLLVMAGPALGAGAFLGGVDDLPLMPGLVENADAGVEFDAPGGRFVEAEASGDVTAAQVRDFYGATLPQLGWTRTGEGLYAREDETLRIEVSETTGRATVKFTIAPADKKTGKP